MDEDYKRLAEAIQEYNGLSPDEPNYARFILLEEIGIAYENSPHGPMCLTRFNSACECDCLKGEAMMVGLEDD